MNTLYGTVSGWVSYANARGDTSPAAAVDADAHLQAGSDYIRRTYVLRFDASVDVTAADVALALEEAAYLAASLSLANPGSLTASFTAGGAKILTKVGELGWTAQVPSDLTATDLAEPRSTAIDRLLAAYLAGEGGGTAGFLAVG